MDRLANLYRDEAELLSLYLQEEGFEMPRFIEIKDDGIYEVLEVLSKPHIRQVFAGWHVLFKDNGVKRFGYIRWILSSEQSLCVADEMHYSLMVSAHDVIVSFSDVLAAGNGYTCLGKLPIYSDGKKIGTREVMTLIERSEPETTLGYINRKDGRAYVELIDGKWQIKTEDK